MEIHTHMNGHSNGHASGNGIHPTEKTSLVQQAQHAYRLNDVEASRLIHQQKFEAKTHDETHDSVGDYVKSMIFGGLDGILTSFAIVAGAAGGGLPVEVVMVLGFSNIFADAFSMGMGEYLSSKAHNEFVFKEKERESWELQNFREGEIKEMIDIYVERGMEPDDAEDVVRKMSKYDDFFVNVMMVEELGLQVPDPNDDIVKEGVVMFLSFAGFGAMPLLGYALIPLCFPSLGPSHLFNIACGVTALTLFLMGAVKSKFSTRGWLHSGLEMLVLGGICAVMAYEIGHLVSSLVGAGDTEGI
ncbi:hypothetical protein NSK_001503 [Nannochloropsis salina CCMP1776]|uniref:Uncharacterized protein n=1 Tax=Nannochloropsis salina CCMP1776 TaxID=1027361 RepID=A0A4D9D629_9STRA|nr:hypothetical protein NSK_001503 [Nannochloropsis salina CCMP1776]|eukprot:TFJ87171.1 hypothetical protein NSK_001503 [Nannochloropsis salina CCMP1776]